MSIDRVDGNVDGASMADPRASRAVRLLLGVRDLEVVFGAAPVLWGVSLVVGRGYGIVGDIIVGIVGAFIGGWLFGKMGWSTPFGGLPGTIFVAFIGACVLLFLLRLIRR